MPVRQETNARFLVQVSIKSQSERKSKRKLLWAEKKVLSEDPGMNQVLDCRQSCVVTLLVFVLPDGVWWLSHPSHRIDLAGHQQKCQSHLIPHNLLPHAVELCSSSLSSSIQFKNPKPCVSAFGTQATGPTRPQSCTWMLKNKSRISSNCSFQISRLSNQNRIHLCHDEL